MKKMLAVLLAVMTLVSVGVLFAAAEDKTEVYVTISDKDGKLAVAAEKIAVTDIDGDTALTINDVLYAAHEAFYEGGAAAGYATEMTQWGLSLSKLWGTANGGSYGYMVNNVSAWSMTDPVKQDDYIAAYVFTEPKTLADKYSYFDKLTGDVQAGDITLTLKKNDYDKDWNPLVLPVAGAEITVDGKATGIKTDAEGAATVTLSKNGRHVVSAVASDQVIVAPIFIATVTGGVDEATPDEATVAPTEPVTAAPAAEVIEAVDATTAPTVAPTVKPTATATKTSSSPKTGDGTHTYLWLFITLASLCGACATVVIYRKRNNA